MPRKITVQTDDAPQSRGTHTQALISGDLVFVNLQTGRYPDTEVLADTLEEQTRLVLSSMEAILNAAGCTQADLVKVTMMMADITYFKAIDDIYREWLPPREECPYPVRLAYAPGTMPSGALVALDAIARLPEA